MLTNCRVATKRDMPTQKPWAWHPASFIGISPKGRQSFWICEADDRDFIIPRGGWAAQWRKACETGGQGARNRAE
jgi:hypothetical protein